MVKFGELLAELRKDRRMTQRDLANELYVTIATISNYENGVHLPDVEKLISLARFFGVTTDYMLGLCSSPLSIDILLQKVPESDGATVGSLIQDFNALNADRRRTLMSVLKDMRFSTMIEEMKEDRK